MYSLHKIFVVTIETSGNIRRFWNSLETDIIAFNTSPVVYGIVTKCVFSSHPDSPIHTLVAVTALQGPTWSLEAIIIHPCVHTPMAQPQEQFRIQYLAFGHFDK